MKFYFSSFFNNAGRSNNFLRPNINCNLISWASGCEPGWACSVGEEQKVNLKDATIMPSRTQNCRPCCDGFFCPHGITCMIPCPLGAYCPQAELNRDTGLCDPYYYQPPPGQPNHTCGGADRWADVGSSGEMFCPAGYYCPSSIRKVPCGSGYYCRKGSTSAKRCFKKSSCKPNSANQNITIFGALLMVALTLILLIIYNFSGQILTNRERRQAKSREAAARSAREIVQARERWKAAKDIAKKHAIGLQTQLSRTFSSRKCSVRNSDQDPSNNYPKASTSKNKEPSNVIEMVRSIDEDPDSNEGFQLPIGDKNIKKNLPKGKEIHTHSQIFKYAYGQIEREKALQLQTNNLTFSGVLSMATDIEIRTRPGIEVSFKDLTLTLKGSKKQLLKSVTGKLMPGRVAAVMGPSGAGKTTFLSALAGKATGCDVSGSVLINGKAESIRSYKKIIGFVPQDDIVHGNLTVEENLWFSARCRLSADMPKPDKVLVVERVIESLGLQPIRDSLVGTVEKRGISGGQRKRVNVGLEMVMEPSLLILDEPTSGLDSSSSQLLLRALRREALEGVNICMVVHQPSYTLFKMFDDLVILAKGGLLVYHGSIKKVEEYFSSLGIDVPERVNPPDHYIDILEGIIKPPGINVIQLPLRWMLHNGYDVPLDMQQHLGVVDKSEKGDEANNSFSSGTNEQSVAGEVWDIMKDAFEHKREHTEENLSKTKDLSNRRTPGVLRQYRYFLGRVGKQRLREARILGVDFLILGLAGVCLGTLAKVSDESFGAVGYTYTVIAVSLLCKIGALRSFSLEKLQYWRERSSGMSSLAYFLSKDTIDHFNTLVKPIVYLSMFYFFNNPRSSILDNYIVLVALVYCVTGIGYVFAICFQPGSAQLWSALLPVVLTLIATQQRDSKILSDLCYTKWALEAFVISNAERYSGVWLITRCGSLMRSGYNIHHWNLCIIILALYGLVSRCFAFFCLVTFQKR
ncbi:ABC transporter G family member 28 [Apostasia shenzhenica]|uniref:ABC transporter G family member 28 n=1 Tax=Apostasia shenzhenica TaxID=1088818 RepID=A0A2H9ZWX9_9ASPA|nr:ABC transporter G family member 28 [Apostasia shenzhenica]